MFSTDPRLPLTETNTYTRAAEEEKCPVLPTSVARKQICVQKLKFWGLSIRSRRASQHRR